ncbi:MULTISPECIES: hypothetical protein [unclassified Streptomyces]|uniref:hypothetical protein n=1 Tax=unclassified Streptomyces TaxID=2593676 RepID=UPI0033A22D6F
MHALERAWAAWDPGVLQVRLSEERPSLGRPIAAHVICRLRFRLFWRKSGPDGHASPQVLTGAVRVPSKARSVP